MQIKQIILLEPQDYINKMFRFKAKNVGFLSGWVHNYTFSPHLLAFFVDLAQFLGFRVAFAADHFR